MSRDTEETARQVAVWRQRTQESLSRWAYGYAPGMDALIKALSDEWNKAAGADSPAAPQRVGVDSPDSDIPGHGDEVDK